MALSLAVFLATLPASSATPDETIQAEASAGRCTRASLKGKFGYSYSGTVRGFGAIAAVGPIDFDGNGNTSATYSVNLDGSNFLGSFTGTYTVNDDCTGSITIDLPMLGTSSNGRFVIINKGKDAFFMGTDEGVTVTGVARKL
jgi:hypothetical protein